jgi:hypothetical protein
VRPWIVIAAAALLGGCAGSGEPQTHVVYQEKDRPVPVACVPSSLRPVQPDLLTREQAAKLDGPQRYAAIAADWLLRVARMNDTEAVIQACSSTTPLAVGALVSPH